MPASSAGARLAALFLLSTLAAGGAAAQTAGADDLAVLHDRCVSYVEAHPQEGLERAKLWRQEGGGFYADHCIAMAMFQLRDYAGAAQRFQSLATAMLGIQPEQRAKLLDQAGQAWLDAQQAARAKAAFDAAIELDGKDPDLLIDRAEAWAEMHQYWNAIDDLNDAIQRAPDRADAYFYRGAAYRNLNVIELAEEDIAHGLTLAPNSPVGLLERGNLRRLKGDLAGARQDWLQVSKLAPGSAADEAARRNLASLKGAAAPATAAAAKKP